MKKIIYTIIASTLLLCFAVPLFAIKAKSTIVEIKQPNGTFITVKVLGDDKFGYYKTLDGYIVAKGKDGYFYYADYNTGTLNLTGIRAVQRQNNTHSGLSKTVPHSLINSHLNNESIGFVAPFGSFYERQLTTTISNIGSKTVEINTIVLLVEFADVKFSFPDIKAKIDAMLNMEGYSYNGAVGSAADYYNSNYRGKASFKFDVSDIITLPNYEAAYGAASGNNNDINVKQMVYDACDMAQSMGMDFSKYDIDNDGKADNVFILFAGYNQAEGGDPSTIWPHFGDISGMKLKCGGTAIGHYACTSELKGYNGTTLASIGTFCHEFGHLLGLVDMYDTNYDFEGFSQGLYKNLSLMDEGNYLNDGNTPPCFTAIEKEMLGLGEVAFIESPRKYEIAGAMECDTIYKLLTTNPNEYFLIECRNGKGWDKYIGGQGMIIYHIDKSSKVFGGIESGKRWIYNNVNSFAQHECAKVISALGQKPVTDISYIFFPGVMNINRICSSGDPSLLDWINKPVGVEIDEIKYADNKISLETIPVMSTDASLPKAAKLNFSIYQTDCKAEWEKDMDLPDIKWIIKWKLSSESDFTNKKIIENQKFIIPDLTPGMEYTVFIASLKGNFTGESLIGEFKSKAYSSRYPLMNIKGVYDVNEEVDLRVFNITEFYEKIIWRIDSQIINEPHYIFTEEREYLVEAEIVYSRGVSDIIKKRVRIE